MAPRLGERASSALYDALNDVIQDGKSKADALLSKNGTPEFVSFFGDIATGYFSRIGLACLKRILDIEDTVSRLDRLVSKLVAAPFSTATGQLAIALRLDSGTGPAPANEHILERYRNALVSFDMARSLADEGEILVIDLCSGLICTRLPSAETEAILHLKSYLSRGLQSLDRRKHEIWEMENEISESKAVVASTPWWGRGIESGFHRGRVKLREKQLPDLQRDYKQLRISLHIVQSLITHLDPSFRPRDF